ncbi:MAG TPA: hypothetical protein DCZ43_01005 [candidate division Zixibacteria bacterium]|nr:hypothetical protein [candidate division Zixibacteria bacterium]
MLGWTLALGLIILLATLFPWEVGDKADILKPAPAHIRPEWYFVFMYQTLKYVPKVVGVFGFAIAGMVWVLLPFFDRKSNRGISNKLYTAIGIIVVAYMIIMTAVAYLAPGE